LFLPSLTHRPDMAAQDQTTARLRARPRLWAFRAAAVVLALAPWVAAEGVLRAFDLGRPALADDPFVGFSAVWPLFELDRTGTRYEIPPAHFKFFRPASFDAVKPRGEFRAFCLGGSTVQGSPFATETAFPAWLQISLTTHDPGRSWRLINCGGISYASYRLAYVLEELLRYQPDLFIICTGQNEFLEDRSYARVKRLPWCVKRPLEGAARLRTFQVLRSLALRASGGDSPTPPRTILGPEVEALLDYRGGLEQYHRDDAWRDAVVAHYDLNLRRMVAKAREAGVPVVLINPVANLDIPPFKSQHSDGLTPEQLRRVEALMAEASERFRTDLPGSTVRLEEALALDDRHAGLHYSLAKCYQALSRPADARREFLRAKDEDVCPLRILEPMRRVVFDVARETGTPLLDADALFTARSLGGITGGDWLVDHVHPSFSGHQLLANALTELLAREGFLRLDPGCLAERDRRYRAHFEALGDEYFLFGQKRLGNQRLWSEGRGNLVRRPQPAPTPVASSPAN
jgi:lysophospholipase L1-like esterase